MRRSALGLLLKGQAKVHWRDESDQRRRAIARCVAAMPVEHLIVIRRGNAADRLERRRRLCLATLLGDLDRRGVTSAILESRGPADGFL